MARAACQMYNLPVALDSQVCRYFSEQHISRILPLYILHSTLYNFFYLIENCNLTYVVHLIKSYNLIFIVKNLDYFSCILQTKSIV